MKQATNRVSAWLVLFGNKVYYQEYGIGNEYTGINARIAAGIIRIFEPGTHMRTHNGGETQHDNLPIMLMQG